MSDEREEGYSEQPGTAHKELPSPAGANEGSALTETIGRRQPDGPRRHGREIWKGIGLAAVLHLLPLLFPALYFGIGIVQIVYLVPAIIICHRRRNTGMVQGLLIAAGITFLLNAACFGWVFVSFNH